MGGTNGTKLNEIWIKTQNLLSRKYIWKRTLQWRHNGRDSISNHQPHVCLLNRLFRRRSKRTSKLCVTGLCAGNSPGTGEFPAQMASYAENVSIWRRHHESAELRPCCSDINAQNLSVRPSRKPCPLCSTSSFGWIHLIYIHLIKQLLNSKIWIFGNFLNFVTLSCFKLCNFDFVLFWLGIWCESLVWVIMRRRGVSQNAVVLVITRRQWVRYIAM